LVKAAIAAQHDDDAMGHLRRQKAFANSSLSIVAVQSSRNSHLAVSDRLDVCCDQEWTVPKDWRLDPHDQPRLQYQPVGTLLPDSIMRIQSTQILAKI
jgi:hypothetical protein